MSIPTSRIKGLQATLVIDRDTASRLGVTAAGYRQYALRRLWPAPGFDHVQAAEPVSRGDGGGPAFPAESRRAEEYLCSSPQRNAGAARGLCALRPVATRRWPSTTRASFPPSPCPSILRPECRFGDAVGSHQRLHSEMGMPANHPRQLSGNGAGISGLAGQRSRLLILAALVDGLYRARAFSTKALFTRSRFSRRCLGGRRRAAGADLFQDANSTSSR